MIPSDVRLFTWLDVQEVIERAGAEQASPPWLVRASAYWNELTISIKSGNRESAQRWIRELFEPRIARALNEDEFSLALEAVSGEERALPVVFEEVDEDVQLLPLP